MPPTLIIQAVMAAISAAPQIEEIAVKGKDFIETLFKHGVITAEQQNAVHAHVDAIAAAIADGKTPPEFVVDAPKS